MLVCIMFFVLLSIDGNAQSNSRNTKELKREELKKIKTLKDVFSDLPVGCNKIVGTVQGKMGGSSTSCPVNKYEFSYDVQVLYSKADVNTKIFIEIIFMDCVDKTTKKRKCVIKVIE